MQNMKPAYQPARHMHMANLALRAQALPICPVWRAQVSCMFPEYDIDWMVDNCPEALACVDHMIVLHCSKNGDAQREALERAMREGATITMHRCGRGLLTTGPAHGVRTSRAMVTPATRCWLASCGGVCHACRPLHTLPRPAGQKSMTNGAATTPSLC